ncbi:MAG: LTA synthase family protein [Verrucomicrobia bacterium]|nr:LTA synthase family protein [Verrucomicrobiota bacterium]
MQREILQQPGASFAAGWWPGFGHLIARRTGGAWIALAAALGVGTAIRLALLGKAALEVSWNLSLLAALAWGTLFTGAAALCWVAPLALGLAALPQRFFCWRWGRIGAHFGSVAVLCGLSFGAVAAWLFWDEFGVRLNFIAVDYLVYTKEVVGNIRESYPMPAIYASLLAVSVALHLLIVRLGWMRRWLEAGAAGVGRRWSVAAGWGLAALGLALFLSEERLPEFANNYNRELAKDGLWSLFAAFRANQLEYDRFYPTMDVDAAFARTRVRLARDGAVPLTEDPHDLLRLVKHTGPEQRLNVVQITVESLSADFLSSFNRASRLTPNLDALARQSLVFERFYATGTRTDRGMEALTLSVPPTPGRSLVKRPRNEGLFTLGSVFRSRGYATAFLYGGYGYFDNMNAFFGGNGYRVIDRTQVAAADVTFANIWGACDEDLYRWTLREADRDFAARRPFHYFVMTTSNHRPFTYPEGRIDLPSKISGRFGAVKYSDYAIGAFLRAAENRPWFRNTVFVIVGDHCASSAGKVALPVQNYHVPLFLYAPGGQIPAGVVKAVTSQIDYAPTLLGLLGWTYPSRFYGRDVLNPEDAQPGFALLGNYQRLALFQENRLHVLSPIRQSASHVYDPETHALLPSAGDPEAVGDTIAYYQTASWLFRHGRQRELSREEWVRYARDLPAVPTGISQ